MTTVTSSSSGSTKSDRLSLVALTSVALLLTLCSALIGLQLQAHGVAVFWPAAGVITGLILTAGNRRHRLAVVLGALIALGIGNLLQRRSIDASVVFMAGNLGEALLISAVLESFVRPARLDSLMRVGVFMLATAVVVAIVGFAMAAGLIATAHTSAGYWRVWQLWFNSHAIGIATVAPALIAARQGWGVRGEHSFKQPMEWARLVAFGILAYLMVGQMSSQSEVGLIAVLAAVYAMLLWISAVTAPQWAAFALLVLSASVAWHTGHGDGLFEDRAYSAQMFLAIAALWTLTLSVLLEQQRQSQRLASESEAMVRDALSVGRAFAFEWDPVSNVVTRSDERGVLGPVRREDATHFFDRIHADDRAIFVAMLGQLNPNSPSYETTYRYLHPDGRMIWLEERASASFDDEGRIAKLRGLTADVTERKTAEEGLREADRMKDRFIATLSHELRNPLAPIRTAVAVLRKQPTEDTRTQWCHQVIERQAAHMAHLLDELLDVSRVSLGKFNLLSEEVELADVLKRAAETVAPQYERGGYRLQIDAPPAPIRLRADPVRLTQAFSNLLSNAAKYADPGSTTRVVVMPAGKEVCIVVHDDGIGIDPAQLDRVFEMFWQIDSSLDRAQGGLGIGLWLVRQIVTLLSGRIEARSEGEGKGSEFVVWLPVVTRADH